MCYPIFLRKLCLIHSPYSKVNNSCFINASLFNSNRQKIRILLYLTLHDESNLHPSSLIYIYKLTRRCALFPQLFYYSFVHFPSLKVAPSSSWSFCRRSEQVPRLGTRLKRLSWSSSRARQTRPPLPLIDTLIKGSRTEFYVRWPN